MKIRRKFLLLALISLIGLSISIFMIIGCGGGGTSPKAPPIFEPGTPAFLDLGVRYSNVNLTYSRSAMLFARVVDNNGDLIDGTTVEFSVNTTEDVVFNNSQQVYRSDTVSGFATAIITYRGTVNWPVAVEVTARAVSVASVYDTETVVIYDNPAVTPNLTLEADPPTIPGNGYSTSIITARLVNGYAIPIEGVTITFSLSPALGTLSATEATTDADGEATVKLTSAKTAYPVTVVVTGDIEWNGIDTSDIASVTYTPQVLSAVTLSADNYVLASGNKTTLTAKLWDEEGFPLIAGIVVEFDGFGCDPDLYSLDSFALTDDNGEAKATLYNTILPGSNNSCVLTVTAGVGVITDSIDIRLSD